MTTADYNKEQAALDGLLMVMPEQYNVIVSVGANVHHKSEPLTIAEASTRMAKLIKFQMSVMGYKQVSYGDCVTLKRGAIEMQIQIAKVTHE